MVGTYLKWIFKFNRWCFDDHKAFTYYNFKQISIWLNLNLTGDVLVTIKHQIKQYSLKSKFVIPIYLKIYHEIQNLKRDEKQLFLPEINVCSVCQPLMKPLQQNIYLLFLCLCLLFERFVVTIFATGVALFNEFLRFETSTWSSFCWWYYYLLWRIWRFRLCDGWHSTRSLVLFHCFFIIPFRLCCLFFPFLFNKQIAKLSCLLTSKLEISLARISLFSKPYSLSRLQYL